jgi:hypothetical protein
VISYVFLLAKGFFAAYNPVLIALDAIQSADGIDFSIGKRWSMLSSVHLSE